MTESFILGLAQQAITIVLILAGPILVTSLVIGSFVSLIQAATQIHEVTLTFIPKMIGIGLVLVLLGSWMTQQVLAFATNIFTNLPNLLH